MRDEELTRWVVRLGREFRLRNMADHLRILRIYYLALEHGLLLGGHRTLEICWSEEMVKDLLAVFRVPPFVHQYALRSREAPCPRCGRSSHNGSTL